ncbi:unnamed protein product [Brassica oleracea]
MDKLPSTNSRLRPDQRHLENGEYHAAKLRLEQVYFDLSVCGVGKEAAGERMETEMVWKR